MTSSAKTLRARDPDPVRVYGAALAMAWQKYVRTFGEVPHGTLEQMEALIELTGGRGALIRMGRYAALKRKRTVRR